MLIGLELQLDVVPECFILGLSGPRGKKNKKHKNEKKNRRIHVPKESKRESPPQPQLPFLRSPNLSSTTS
jgi:hypothetical protein